VLTTVAVLLAAGAAITSVRWWLTRVDSLGRAQAFPAWSVAGLVVLAVAAGTPQLLRARLEHRLQTVATTLVGKPVDVRCQSFGQSMVDAGMELGWVPYDPSGTPLPETLIKREPCADLADYLSSDRRSPSRDQVVAVHVLTHESMHMAGVVDEARTECAAVQRDAWTARLLGASDQQAQRLAAQYWREVYPTLHDSYRSGGCGPAGALDEGRVDAPWSFADPADDGGPSR